MLDPARRIRVWLGQGDQVISVGLLRQTAGYGKLVFTAPLPMGQYDSVRHGGTGHWQRWTYVRSDDRRQSLRRGLSQLAQLISFPAPWWWFCGWPQRVALQN